MEIIRKTPGVYIVETNTLPVIRPNHVGVLNELIKDLNKFLSAEFPQYEDLAILSSMNNADGSVPVNITNKAVISVVKFDDSFQQYNREDENPGSSMDIAVAVNFTNYTEGLGVIRSIADYFKFNFSPGVTPLFEPRNLRCKPVRLGYTELAAIKSSLGIVGCPPLFYQLDLNWNLKEILNALVPQISEEDAGTTGEDKLLSNIESGLKMIFNSFVFYPNNLSSWTSIRYFTSEYLFLLWQKGLLKGNSHTDAYSVNIGLGNTMTSEDLLTGFCVLSVMVAINNPAEFTVITITQEIQMS